MRVRHISVFLVTGSAFASTLAVGMPAASARVPCNDGESYRVTQHKHEFIQVASVTGYNHTSVTQHIGIDVGESHTMTKSFTGTITVGAEGGFFGFAKVKAETSASVQIASSMTMSTTYSAPTTIPPKTAVTVRFGFDRYDQYIQQYHLYNTSATSCGVAVDQAGWVKAPYEKAFVFVSAPL